MQLATFYPDRISIRSHKKRSIIDVYNAWYSKESKSKSIENLGIKKNKVHLSKSSRRDLINSINSLYFHSPARAVQLSNKKSIYNFKASFITLTLPSNQVHSDVIIKARLNVFLQLLRSKYEVNNYVWKAELQGNSNIHFHLIIDKYINYGALKYYWNKAIKPLGYIDEYEKKFQNMSLSAYINLRSGNDKVKAKLYFNNYSKAYYKGQETKWRSPNSIDVVSVKSTRSLGHYLAKYMTKAIIDDKGSGDQNISVRRLNEFGKVWSRSTSLSRLKYKNRLEYDDIKEVIFKLKNVTNACIDRYFDYCRVIYLRLENCPQWFVTMHKTILNSMAKMDLYPVP